MDFWNNVCGSKGKMESGMRHKIERKPLKGIEKLLKNSL